jgi:Arc/MetJ-type ribon-helix-helix transcriptional regulator
MGGATVAERFVTVRFSNAQMEHLEALVDARGVSRSDVIRQLVVEASLTPEERESVPDERELVQLLADKARAGNVSAIKTLLDRCERRGWDDPDDPFDEFEAALAGESTIDRLARRGGSNHQDEPTS